MRTAPASSLELIEQFGHHPGVATSRLQSSGRRSFFLEWRTSEGNFRGEASPLPGYGFDDPEQARVELSAVRPEVLERFQGDRQDLSFTIEELEQLSRPLSSPSARFALETVWLRKRAWDAGLPVWQLLREAIGLGASGPPPVLRTSAVLDAWTPGAFERARALVKDGVTTFKIKCGRDWSAEKSLLETLPSLGPVRLRLDPNLAWTPAELARAADELSPSLPIEFIEDPTPNPTEWTPSFPFPFAIDEPLGALEPSREAFLSFSACFVVLKPMALGGFARCLRWAEVASTIGVRCIVSHLFDGPLALDAAIELAFAVQGSEHAAGLGLHAGLQAFPEKSRFLAADRLIRPTPERS